jgi:hypothetical protein
MTKDIPIIDIEMTVEPELYSTTVFVFSGTTLLDRRSIARYIVK